jgi:hypothetical protein
VTVGPAILLTAEAAPPECDPQGDAAALTKALAARLDTFQAACAERGGVPTPLGARSAAARFATPGAALDAIHAARAALAAPFGAPDFRFRLGLGLGLLSGAEDSDVIERPAGGDGGETRASLSFVALARAAG